MQNLSEQTPTTQRFDGVIKRDVISDMKVGIIGLGAVGNPLSRIIAGMKPGDYSSWTLTGLDQRTLVPNCTLTQT